MNMLLRDVTQRELADILKHHAHCVSTPELRDPAVIRRARRLARRNGIWDALQTLDPARPIPVLTRSAYRNYLRTGDRTASQDQSRARRAELNRAALALWLSHPKAHADYLQDLVWAVCEEWTWVMAAHETRTIDLGSAMTGATLAQILFACHRHLEDEVVDRVRETIDQRLFTPFSDYRRVDDWDTTRNNWNTVCNGEIVYAALICQDTPEVLARLIYPAIQHMTHALDGFADDGGCLEGPGYWAYGFGHYLKTAYALWQRTGGAIDLMDDPTGKIARICRYPLAAHIAGPWRATFSDATHGYLPPLPALLINRFIKLPELYTLCERNADQTLKVGSMSELALYSGFKPRVQPENGDAVLPDLGMAKLRSAAGPRQMTLLCLAGCNGVPHNHNDIGSFIVHKHGRLPLVDPGSPVYRRETFSPRRYEILFCNSRGHSVPVINGKLQPVGKQYAGTLDVRVRDGDGMKEAVIDMTHAYPEGTVRDFSRTFSLDVKGHALTIEDSFGFDRKPRALEEAFVTFERVALQPDGVRIGAQRHGVTLQTVDSAGTFDAERCVEASKAGKSGQILTRIVFRPHTLSRRMTLRFRIQ